MHTKLNLIVFASALAACASANQSAYSDQLDNGWQDWSWATVNQANSSPVHTGSHSVSISMGAWQGFYLHHDAFSTAPFTTLDFYINGGATGGQKLQLQATLSGTGGPAVPITVSANTWTHISIPLSSLGAANASNFDGFWIQDTTGGNQPTFYVDDISLIQTPPPNPVTLNVNANQPLYMVSSNLFGVNTAVWDAALGSSTTANYVATAGIQFLRFPGGSLSDGYHWATNTTDSNTWTWATDFDHFAAVAVQDKTNAIITTNYGTGTAQEAANWVKYSNVTKGYPFHYWEVGNECFGSWEEDAHARPHDPYTYAQQFALYYRAIKAVDRSAKVGAVLVTGEDSYVNYVDHPAMNPRTQTMHNGWTPVMLATLKSLGVVPDFVVYHFYAQSPGSESDDALLGSTGNWATDIPNIRQMLNDYLGTTWATNVKIMITENNSVYSNPGKQSVSLVNALYLADSIANVTKTEAAGFVWWDLRNGQETSNNNSASLYGWRQYGDYGIVSGSNDRYPTYYAFEILRHFARNADVSLGGSSNYYQLPVYAVKHPNGTVSVMVINKTPSMSLPAQINFSGFTPQGSAYVWSYGIPQDNAAKTGVGSPDVALKTISNAGSTFSYTFPPYSITVFLLQPVAAP